MEFTILININGNIGYELTHIDKKFFGSCRTKDEERAIARSLYQKDHPNAHILAVISGNAVDKILNK